jgi:hypothetical protein
MRTDHHARTGVAILFTAVLLTAGFGGCASEPKPRPTAVDPSNPAAPESPPLALAALSPTAGLVATTAQPTGERTEKPPAPPVSGTAGKSGKQPAIVYTCPMHPEVTSDKPGRCPKCGMNLVPKQPAEGKK